MRLTITTDFKDVNRALASMPREIGNRAAASTLNKVAAQAKTQMVREITSEFNLTAKKVREKLAIRRASFKGGLFGMEAELFSSAKKRSINLINFSARQVGKGVSVKIKKGGPRKLVRSAFIGNSGRTVFKRRGKERLPIDPVQTIDVPMMFNTRRVNAKVVAFIRRKLPEVFQREVAFYLSRFGS